MPKKRRQERRKNSPSRQDRPVVEEGASEAVTVAWTVSVTGVLLANLIVVATNMFARVDPGAEAARVFEGVMLLSAAAMGATSLVLMAIVWRVRRVKPPRGYVVFAVLISAAPIIATVARLMR